jgi:hypothetical protein
MVMNEIPFPCHMTHTGMPLSWDKAGTPKYPLCRGALTFMRKMGKTPRSAELKKAVDTIQKNEFALVLSGPEFIEHHENGFQKAARKIKKPLSG